LKLQKGKDIGVMESSDSTDYIESLERQISSLQREALEADEKAKLTSLEKELSIAFIRKFKQSQAIEDIRNAQSHTRAAVNQYNLPNQEDMQTLLLNLANCLFLEYRISKDRHLLDDAILNFRRVINLPFKDIQHKVSLIENFWLVLKDKIGVEAALDDVQDGINALRDVITTEGSFNYLDPSIIRDLLALYLIKFDCVDGYPDLDDAIKIAKIAIKISSVHDPDGERDTFQHNLATFLDERFRRSRNPEDLDQSIAIWRQLVESARANGESLRMRLNGLSLALRNKYLLTGVLDDLEAAIKVAYEGVHLGSPVHEESERKDAVLINLSICLAARFEELGDISDIDEAIRLGNEAIQESNSDRDRVKYRNNLATYYSTRYSAKGDADDLDMTIEIGRQLVDQESNDTYTKPAYLGNLSSWLQDRYDAAGALIDLKETIDFARQSISGELLVRDDRIVLRSNLCERLSRWYSRTKELPSLDEAIRLMREVLHDCGEHHPMSSIYRNNLGNYLTTRFQETQSVEDITEAISLVNRALQDTAQTNPNRANFWNSMGSHHHDMFSKTGSKVDLDNSIEAARQATETVKFDQPIAVYFFNNLGNLLLERSLKFGAKDDRDEAKVYLGRAADHRTGSLIVRIEAALVSGRLHAEDQDLPIAFELLHSGVLLLSRVSPRSISRDDQQRNITGLSGISALACSVALAANKTPEESLALLESGRAIISGLSTHISGDVLRLEAAYPELCARYKNLREKALNVSRVSVEDEEDTRMEYLKQLDGASAIRYPLASYAAKRDSFKILDDLDKLEQKIRQLPSFDRFQMSPSGQQCMLMASNVPIVYFNVTQLRSDAILITKSRIATLQLQDLKYSDLESNAKHLTGKNRVTSSGYLGSKADRNQLLLQTLRWLWDVAVKPVLGELGLLTQRKSEQQRLPRIYWVASGVMGMMPFHAAGVHEPNSTDNTISHVVSTYNTTLKSLAQSQELTVSGQSFCNERALVIAMPTTPGKRPIKAEEEADILTQVYTKYGAPAPEVCKHPSKADVKNRLSSFKVVHFACHGNSSLTNPSKGGLFLGAEHGKDAEHLSIAELSTVRPKNARLAYLSACSTAENLAEELVDEVIHTASSFQLLGFPHVIGTFWEAGNGEALKVVEKFYDGWLGCSGDEYEQPAAVAYALHNAILYLREHGIPTVRRAGHPHKNVLSWAPFIHIGV
jgi:CHAT domain